ncbi:MAG: acyltransferase family protein [Chloroflexota bacterium]|nr:acyltransferase family protein [Chloroflexota bacterium]
MHERLNWIDWLKVTFVFGAFVFHVAQPFVLSPWLISNTEKSVALSLYSGFGYLFGMPLMFLLAGATTWLATERTGVAGHAAVRIRRLFVPLLLGLIILSPLQAWISTLAGGHLEDPGAFLARYLGSMRLPLSLTWFGDYGYHLWFLAFLFFDVLLVLPLLPRLRAARDAGTLSIGAFAGWPVGLAAIFAALLLPQLILRPLFPVYRDWADFILWLGYFGIGVLAMADRGLLAALVARRRRFLWLLPAAAIALIPILPFGSPLDLEHAPGFGPIGLAYIAWRTALSWLMVVSLIGFASIYLGARPRFLAWASGLVLPFYVLHHPVVVIVAALVVGLGIGMWAKFGLILLVSLTVTLLLCAAVIRGPAALARRFTPLRPAAEPAAERR